MRALIFAAVLMPNVALAQAVLMGNPSDGRFTLMRTDNNQTAVFRVTGTSQLTLDAAFILSTGTLTLPDAGLVIGGATTNSVPFLDSAGLLTLQQVDAIDNTTETTIENAIDTLGPITVNGDLTVSGSVLASVSRLPIVRATTVTAPVTCNLANEGVEFAARDTDSILAGATARCICVDTDITAGTSFAWVRSHTLSIGAPCP